VIVKPLYRIYRTFIPGNPCVLARSENLIEKVTIEEVFTQIYDAKERVK
jgi:hypothetical protein